MLQIENTGSGFIGPVAENWRIQLTSTPHHVGERSGHVGSVDFSASCDGTTKFTIDNYLTVKHFYNDQTARWLSTFDVYVRNITTNGDYGRFSGISRASLLDVQRTVTLDTAGQYQRKIVLPEQEEYVISAVTYYTGGAYTTVEGQQVWQSAPMTIHGVAADEDFLYVLASGSHNGEIVMRFYCDGVFQTVWPVYSDATDTSGPQSRSISVANNYVVIGQTNAKRVKMFDPNGVFIRQWGSNGSANGQFSAVSGVAISNFFDSVYVTDSVLGRVQRFNYSGVYQNKWGTAGTGTGNLVFNEPNSIAIDPVTEMQFVADMNARVRAYDWDGTYLGTVMGSYDFTLNQSNGPFKEDVQIGIGFDFRGNAYGFQGGKVRMYARNSDTGAWEDGSENVKQFMAHNYMTETFTHVATGDSVSGQMYYVGSGGVEVMTGTPGSLPGVINHYIAKASPDFPTRFFAINEPMGNGPYPYIGWEGNVWEYLCDLCAATGNAMAAFDDKVFIFNREDRSFLMPEDVQIEPMEMNSIATGQYVEVTNHNASWVEFGEIYNANWDGTRVFSTGINEISYFTVDVGTHVQHAFSPEIWAFPDQLPPVGRYMVFGTDTDNETVMVPAGTWVESGGNVLVEPGEKPGTILITLIGPSVPPISIGDLEINGPYNLVNDWGDGALSIMGSGVYSNPETIMIGTGVSESITSNLVAKTITSPFLYDAATAYTEGSAAAYNAGTPHQRIKFKIPITRGYNWALSASATGGTFQFSGVRVLYEDSEYIIDSVECDLAFITLSGYRYNSSSHPTSIIGPAVPRFEQIWNGISGNYFDAYWSDYTAQDFTIAPLRNPFGFNARLI
jgi:hypothetical protein